VSSLAILLALGSAFECGQAQTRVADTRVGSALNKSLRLVYGSGGSEQAPWVVDSLDLTASWQGRTCSYIRFGTTDVRRHCLSGDTLFNWNEAQARLIAARPVGPRSTLRLPTSSGGSVLYETEEPVQATVSGRTFSALPTTVTTFDATGNAIRRLRERYVVALATALGGVFEIPDPARPGQWQIQREFSLVRIE
jgi:hypothetical protein